MAKIKKLKDIEYTDAIIKITKVKEHYSDGKGCHTMKEKLICVTIEKPYVTTSTCFPDNKKGKKELIEWLKEEMYWR